MEIATLMMTQCPTIGALIWFLIYWTKQTENRFEKQQERFERSLETIVDKLGERLDRIEDKIQISNPNNDR